MRIPLQLLIGLLLLSGITCAGQGVLAPVYERTHIPRTSWVSSFDSPYFNLKEVNDPDSTLLKKLHYYAVHYRKAPTDIQGCTYFYPNQTENIHAVPYPKVQPSGNSNPVGRNPVSRTRLLPSFLRFYADTSFHSSAAISDPSPNNLFGYEFGCTKSFSEFYRPFYFKNTEVSNDEYREFVTWVRDSIGRTILLKNHFREFAGDSNRITGRVYLNWKTPLDWSKPEYHDAIDTLMLPEGERFYRRREFDPRKFIYVYANTSRDGTKRNISIQCYPDTMVWTSNFPYAFQEPMENMYYWHPAYGHYPVVGISKRQAEAFLHWKTVQAQKALEKKQKGWKIEYDLPSEYQWEMVASSERGKNGPGIFQREYYNFIDNSFLTDLQVCMSDTFSRKLTIRCDTCSPIDFLFIRRNDEVNKLLKRDVSFPGNLLVDGYYHMAPVDFKEAEKLLKRAGGRAEPLFKVNRDENGIFYMGGNVSELMKDTYDENWLPLYTRRHALMKKFGGKDLELTLAIEDYYNSQCYPHGTLVRGSNWYDERYNNFYGKNTAGMNAKTFIDPEKGYSTVGFRYVVRMYRVAEPR